LADNPAAENEKHADMMYNGIAKQRTAIPRRVSPRRLAGARAGKHASMTVWSRVDAGRSNGFFHQQHSEQRPAAFVAGHSLERR
jgi:hypothetical protein